MAAKKDGEKEAKLTPEQQAALVLDYLRKENRPYSATDISSNLKNRVTKAAAAKLLKDLHERGEIEGRAAGKQQVYHALQEEPEEDLIEQLQQMEEDTKRIRKETIALKSEEKELRQLLKQGADIVPLPELKSNIAEMEKQKLEKEARLKKLESGNVKPVSAADRTRVDKAHRRVKKAADARKKIRKEMWKEIEQYLENAEQKQETKESLDLDL
ncbi:hypothetical protein M409DRAFT_64672 [Zasmidium cellare ATCC 36951]|uniref:Homologous-pairing protein 2 winged helix domain-containing protein n=1 Tax=Zasmidium cellare ATCC 36951 TaxID=1080233 RepID=A0A6A6CR70_ZASCE|nr:uncharacterized protein M409DRAFT_64672 [Zasmidium cellare ATCC 36951]KAF2169585.1 hypothetical protein M409DRAFT_64672 [Zasmidium cellare ATCC 36951]